MKFFIEYTGYTEQRTLLYRTDEYSFDMEPLVSEIDYDIAIDRLQLTVVNDRVVQLWGVCGLLHSMKTNIMPPESKKGILGVTDELEPGFSYDISDILDDVTSGLSYSINELKYPVYRSKLKKWFCIGYPEKQGNAVEFINNCIAVIDDNGKFLSLWLKPEMV